MLPSQDKKQPALTTVEEKTDKAESEKKTLETLEKALQEERRKSEDYLTRLKYLQADFENYQKRIKKAIEEVTNYCNEDLIKEFLEVMDELELAIQNGEHCKSYEGFINGLKMILKKFYKILEKQGVTKIESVGKSVDPTRHEVVSKIFVEDQKDNIIVEEIRKGFMYKGKVIRPSMVKVAIAQSPINNNKSR
jgi:molecular chaperone GrpE